LGSQVLGVQVENEPYFLHTRPPPSTPLTVYTSHTLGVFCKDTTMFVVFHRDSRLPDEKLNKRLCPKVEDQTHGFTPVRKTRQALQVLRSLQNTTVAMIFIKKEVIHSFLI